MDFVTIKPRKKLFTVLGGCLARYRIAMVIFHIVMVVLDIIFMISWYNDPEVVPQIADKAMYENKKFLKEKYNMKGR